MDVSTRFVYVRNVQTLQNIHKNDSVKEKHLYKHNMSTATPSLPATLPQMVRHSASQFADSYAISDGDFSVLYKDLPALTEQVASALIASGVQAGDRVAIWAPNMAEWVLAACGTHMAGGVVVPINTRMKGMEAADLLERSQSKVLFSMGEFLGTYYPDMLKECCPSTLEKVVVLRDTPRNANESTWDDFLALATDGNRDEIHAREAALTADSTSDMMFTSGTTGKPKGVLSKHGATIRAFDEWARVVGLNAGDNYLIINPFFHSFGYKAGWIAALLRGATIYPHQVFDAGVVLQRIQDEKITFLPGPPTLFHSMLDHEDLGSFDIASLTSTVTGAASVPPVLIKRMRDELGFDNVTTAYGLTECGGVATICDPADDVETVAHYCGKALPGTELRVVDGEGKDMPAGEAGEVVLRGYHVMKGYYDNEKATAETIDADGWLHTGDVGVLNEQGYLKITDRLKDMFIVGGFNCYPAEIENLLSEHPAVAQVAVLGVPDERMGEVGCACIITKAGATFDADELKQWSRANMANYKVPRYYLQFESFPISATNKVLKREMVADVRERLKIA